MLVKDLLIQDDNQLAVISQYCRQFIKESDGLPLYKGLSTSYSDIHKVKIRHRKTKTQIGETFNEAFKSKFSQLQQRALFAYASNKTVPIVENQETFYVFPIDGYKYMYNATVTDSTSEYKKAFDAMLEQFSDDGQAEQILADLLQYSYTSNNLNEGLQRGAEIIMYNIPFYFAVRTSCVDSYNNLLTSLD